MSELNNIENWRITQAYSANEIINIAEDILETAINLRNMAKIKMPIDFKYRANQFNQYAHFFMEIYKNTKKSLN